MLAVDLNANGTIDGASELFGGVAESGFDALAAFDSNSDGVISGGDTEFATLRVWQDLDQDMVTDAGELKTLDELGITSIGLAHQNTGTQISLNVLARTGSFTRADESTGTVGDVQFRVNNFDTEYVGDKSVNPAIAATMLNLKGHGTLADLHVVLTLEANDGVSGTPLADTIGSVLPTLDVVDMEVLRDRAMAILEAWMEASPGPQGLGGHADVPVLVERTDIEFTVHDFAIQVTEQVDDGSGGTMPMTFWRLASGTSVLDENSDEIEFPDLEDVLAQVSSDPAFSWETVPGAQIDFFERFFGESVPVDDARSLNSDAIGALGQVLETTLNMVDLMAVRLAAQGPLQSYFDGIEYQVDEDKFVGTTDRQLVPMFEAIFADAPGDEAGAQAWLNAWEPIVDAVLADYDRGGSHLAMTHAFVFTTVVAATENTDLVLDVKTAATSLGVPESLIRIAGDEQGTTGNDLIYVSTGDDLVSGGTGADTYVIGADFGTDVIDDAEPYLSHEYDVGRLAHLNPEDVTLYRGGHDLRIVDNASGDSLTVDEQFHDLATDLNGNHVGIEHGIDEIVFADGTVWARVGIAYHTINPLATNGDDVLAGTDHVDFLSGREGNDIYLFDLGDGERLYPGSRRKCVGRQRRHAEVRCWHCSWRHTRRQK
jgi:hypothetical protein